MNRYSFEHDGLTFSYLDAGGEGKVVIALHGHWMGGSDFEGLALALAPEWRVVALDLRSFGETDHTRRHSSEAYVGDVSALLDHIGIKKAVPIIGHSFGGVVAYLAASSIPERVANIVIVDIGVVLDDDDTFVRSWSGVFPRREALEEKLGERMAPYFQKSIRRVEGGWCLNFDPEEFLLSEHAINGDHWKTWRSSRCPALVIRGQNSPVTDENQLNEMAETRKKTKSVSIAAGHSVHIDKPSEFAEIVQNFLEKNSHLSTKQR